MTTRYVATINTPGYLPWDDEPPVFETIREAWDYLAEERNRAWNDTEGMGPDWDPVMNDMANAGQQGLTGAVYGSTPGYEGDHDLGLAYCVSVYEGEED